MWPVSGPFSSIFSYYLWVLLKSMDLVPKSLPVEEYSDEELDEEMDEEVEEEEDIEESPVKKVTKNDAGKVRPPLVGHKLFKLNVLILTAPFYLQRERSQKRGRMSKLNLTFN